MNRLSGRFSKAQWPLGSHRPCCSGELSQLLPFYQSPGCADGRPFSTPPARRVWPAASLQAFCSLSAFLIRGANRDLARGRHKEARCGTVLRTNKPLLKSKARKVTGQQCASYALSWLGDADEWLMYNNFIAVFFFLWPWKNLEGTTVSVIFPKDCPVKAAGAWACKGQHVFQVSYSRKNPQNSKLKYKLSTVSSYRSWWLL